METCPRCGSRKLIYDEEAGEIVCQECGCVAEQAVVDKGPEWRTFEGEEETQRRVGPPETPLLHDKGLATGFTPLSEPRFKRMAKITKWIGDNKTLVNVLKEIRRICEKMKVPRSVMEYSAVLVKRASKCGITRGRPIAFVAGAAIYVSCKTHGVPRTLDEVLHALALDGLIEKRSYKITRRGVWRVVRLMKEHGIASLSPTKPEMFVQRLVDALHLSQEVSEKALEIIKEARRIRLTNGKAPVGVAAAAILLAAKQCNERLPQKMVARAAGITEVTLRNRYKELTKALKSTPHGLGE